jgi:hypothetical protein
MLGSTGILRPAGNTGLRGSGNAPSLQLSEPAQPEKVEFIKGAFVVAAAWERSRCCRSRNHSHSHSHRH